MNKSDRILVAGAGGFIGGWLVRDLLNKGFTNIVAVDIKDFPSWYQIFDQPDNRVLDLRESQNCLASMEGVNVVYNLAADMGGMGFIENNKALCIYSEQRHYSTRTTILPRVTFQAPPPQGGPQEIFNLLNASISCQANAMELLHTTHVDTLVFHKEKETKKKDRFQKFHPSAKQLILFASASDINDVPTKPEDTCEHFMNATTQGIAEQELSMQFRAMGLGDVAYATGLTLNLYSGKFLYAVHNNPSNFSCFSIHEGTHLDKEEQQDRQLLLHLIKTKEKGQSIKEIKLLNKQIIKAPMTYHEMLLQLDFFAAYAQCSLGNSAGPCI
jgi:hypothetical protein